jgi:hypothetical protein
MALIKVNVKNVKSVYPNLAVQRSITGKMKVSLLIRSSVTGAVTVLLFVHLTLFQNRGRKNEGKD